MVEVIPAIMPDSLAEVMEEVSRVRGAVDFVQIDIMNGTLTQGFTWPYTVHSDEFQQMIDQEEGLPFWQDVEYEIDMMIDSPEEALHDWIRAGASRIILHFESMEYPLEVFKNFHAEYGENEYKTEIMLSLAHSTPLADIRDAIEFVDGVQVMGIDPIGVQGSAFQEATIGRVRQLREWYPDLPISVDGGVTFENAKALVEAGVDRLVSGSLVFNPETIPGDVIAKLQSI